MQSFTVEAYEFEIDGVRYSIPELSVDGFQRIAALYKIEDTAEQVAAFRDSLLAEADDDAANAIRRLSIGKIARLFRGWTGLGGDDAGEAGGSSN